MQTTLSAITKASLEDALKKFKKKYGKTHIVTKMIRTEGLVQPYSTEPYYIYQIIITHYPKEKKK